MSGIKEIMANIRGQLEGSRKDFEKRYKWRIDNVKQKLIGEFLRDWKWGNVLKSHIWSYHKGNCYCPHHSIYWKWFENKWEGMIK